MRNGLAQWVDAGPIEDWLSFPDDACVDVAAINVTLIEEYDHMAVGVEAALTQKMKDEFKVEVGDAALVMGLFRHHQGSKRNIPIVRTGNLAVMNEEKVNTQIGMMDAYLIEARSIGGLSGSPVFINCGNIRAINGVLKTWSTPVLIWLGLIHGHFDTLASTVDDVVEDSLNSGQINVGIAIVVPVEKILELITTDYELRLKVEFPEIATIEVQSKEVE